MANPILNDKFVTQEQAINGQVMTVNGTIQIAILLGIIMLLGAGFTWTRFTAGYTDLAHMLTFGGAIVGFILALIIAFTRTKYLVPVYAACEGLCLGGISAQFEVMYPALFSMLFLYRIGAIKCTDKFRSIILISTLAIAGVYLINFIGSFWGYSVPLLNSSSNLGIGVSVIITVIAALNLILDFDFIEKASTAMAPKDYEWYGAFGLMVTLVWLYLEILRLLAKFSDRR